MEKRLRIKSIILLVLLVLFSACAGEIEHKVSSPDGSLEVEFTMFAGSPFYSAIYKGDTLISRSGLGFRIKNAGDLTVGFEITGAEKETVNETWKPVWGVQSEVVNNYNQLTFHLKEVSPPERKMDVIFRAYNDGIAFRYVFPENEEIDSLLITDEATEFNFAGDHSAWWIPGDYNTYELLYRNTPLSRIDSANTPVTLEAADSLYISVHEADLTDWAGMTLAPSDNPNSLKAKLVPWPDGVKVRAKLPHRSPWRVIQVADSPGGLIESEIILNLNEPSKIEDVSWIEPMKYIGIWWSHHIDKTTFYEGPRQGATTEEAKRYIDFAAANGIKGFLVEGWNTDWGSWGEEGAFNFLQSNSNYNLEEVAEYAKSKNVSLIIHNETGGDIENYERQIDEAFDYYQNLGIHANKTGYARGGGIIPENQFRHGQWMVRHYRMVVEKAAEHKIMLDAHEPIKPTGIERTWPNMMTREGVRGNEWNAWSEGNPPEHEVILPFTRMLAGPLDYTPGIFDLTYDEYKKDERVHTTIAKQLALFVILYSPMQMAADLPENYEGNPMFQFIRDVPVNWDESVVLNGKIGDYITIARRQGDEWYIGSATDENPRDLKVSLDFLKEGAVYSAQIYADAESTDWKTRPHDYEISGTELKKGDEITLRLAAGGGQAIRLKPVNTEPGS